MEGLSFPYVIVMEKDVERVPFPYVIVMVMTWREFHFLM